jgi:hypothetical protein
MSDPLSYLQAVLSKDYTAAKYRESKKKSEHEALLVTLSRDYGAEGEVIAKELAECLKIPLYDSEILDLVAKRGKTDKFFFEHHDEQSHAGLSTFLYSLVSGTTATLQNYRRYLYDVILDLAKKDGLIIGRGAHLVLTGKRVFRVRIVGSKTICAGRIAKELGIPQLAAEQKVFEINNKRHQSVKNLYDDSFKHCSLEHATNFDLVLNTDNLPASGAVAVILLAMQQAGYDLRNRA